jgi:hypothetical protein
MNWLKQIWKKYIIADFPWTDPTGYCFDCHKDLNECKGCEIALN